MAQRGFELFAPARHLRREATQSKKNRCGFKAGIESAATIEADLLRIEFVEIMEDAANDEALVIVERVFENPHGVGTAIEH